jgi:four helix bundle protein
MNAKPTFDHEKLDVYQLELSFLAWVTPLLHEVRNASEGFHREVCDQIDRASLSSLLNTAEGNGKRQGRLRAKYFDDARGSAVECVACLDAMVAKRLSATERVVEGKAMLLRIVGMLTKLVERFDGQGTYLREDEEEFRDTNGYENGDSRISYRTSKKSASEEDGRARGRGGRKAKPGGKK